MLAAYWISKVLGGQNPVKTSIDVVGIERRSALKQAQKAGTEKRESGKSVTPDRKSKEKKKAGIVRSSVFKKAVKSLLRSEKII